MKLTLIFLFLTISSYSQNIKGLILDENNNKPLSGVNIYFKNTKEGTSSNEKGEFNLKVHSKFNESDTIYFSCIGYATKKVSFSELKVKKNIICLSIDIQHLKEVTVVPSKLLKPRIHYNKLSPLKDGLFSFGSLLNDNKIYVIGGDLSFEEDKAKEILIEYFQAPKSQSLLEQLSRATPEFSWQEFSGSFLTYDIETDIWKVSDLKLIERAYHNIHLYNGKIYVLGGKTLSKNKYYEYLADKIEVIDTVMDTVLIDNTNPHQSINFASFNYGSNIILLGGSIKMNKFGEKEYSKKSHLYNLESGYWYELKDMINPKETKGVLINNKIYLIGGFNKEPLKEIDTYDLLRDEWKIEGELFRGLERPALTYHNNIIYIFEDGRIYTYNTENKELNEYLIDLNLKSSELFYTNNMLYILGGFVEDDFSVSTSSGLFSINLNEFEKTKINHSKTFNSN